MAVNNLPDKTGEWILPTIFGMCVATMRRFRRKPNEKWRVVIVRFLAHSGTCVIAGYITAGLLNYLNVPSLIAPVCALAGLYGTMLVDWIEEEGFPLFTAYIKNRLNNPQK